MTTQTSTAAPAANASTILDTTYSAIDDSIASLGNLFKMTRHISNAGVNISKVADNKTANLLANTPTGLKLDLTAVGEPQL